MKIGIITIHNSPSYGGSLQSYALYKYLCDLGYDAEIIDLYRPTHEGYKSSLHHQHNRISIIAKLLNFIKVVFCIRTRKQENSGYNQNFVEFNSQIKLSRSFDGVDALYSNPPAYDAYITGSDQVWNPMQPYLIEPYFLTFVADKKSLKISYAASIGISRLLPTEEALFKSWIEQYDSVSVREEELKNYLETFVNKKIIRVADPSFLLDRKIWKELSANEAPTTPYILLFELAHNKELVRFCKRMAQQANMPLIVLNQSEPESVDNSYTVINDAGPRQFLNYIGNAKMVITDSFHGTVFSIIMEANNFYSYIAPGNARGSRITDLLKSFQIEDHLLNPDLKQSWTELFNNKLDKAKIDQINFSEQQSSRNFLKGSLNNS